MTLPAKTKVLVVGAGPSGLASAITIASLGLEVVIVDSNATNANGSRAAVLHSQTLEALAPVNLAQPIIDAGIVSPGERVLGSTNKLMDVDMSTLDRETPYPFSILISQHAVENIFLQYIAREKIPLFRNKKVVTVRPLDDHRGVEVTFEDGTNIITEYIVGADGSRSTVRQLSGIEFKDPRSGSSYDDTKPDFNMALADVYLQEPLPPALVRDRISFHLDNFLVLCPLRPEGSESPHEGSVSFWRIGYKLPPGGIPPHNPSLEYFETELNKRNHWDTKLVVNSVVTSSRYRVRYAVATKYFSKLGEGKILLAGDAAHVHSPAGGQGVNTGICDGVAVAHAIHSHTLTGKDTVLQEYSDVRRKIGLNTVEFTRTLTELAGNSWRKYWRDLKLQIVGNISFANKQFARSLSGLIHQTA